MRQRIVDDTDGSTSRDLDTDDEGEGEGVDDKLAERNLRGASMDAIAKFTDYSTYSLTVCVYISNDYP